MAFGNRLISTGSGAGGVTGASLLSLDFNFSSAWKYGMEYDGNYMYNISKNSKLIGVGQWTSPASISTHATGGGAWVQGFAACSDGTFLMCNRDQYQVYRFNSSFVNIAVYGISGRNHDITALPNGFAITDEDNNNVRIYDYNGSYVSGFSASQGTGSGLQGIAYDGGGLWVSSGLNQANAVCYKYGLNGTPTGDSFTNWANRKLLYLAFYDNIFYSIGEYGTASQYQAF